MQRFFRRPLSGCAEALKRAVMALRSGGRSSGSGFSGWRLFGLPVPPTTSRQPGSTLVPNASRISMCSPLSHQMRAREIRGSLGLLQRRRRVCQVGGGARSQRWRLRSAGREVHETRHNSRHIFMPTSATKDTAEPPIQRSAPPFRNTPQPCFGAYTPVAQLEERLGAALCYPFRLYQLPESKLYPLVGFLTRWPDKRVSRLMQPDPPGVVGCPPDE